MWLAKLCIVFSFCLNLNLGQVLNSTVYFRSDNSLTNSSYFNNNGNINRIVGGKPINIAQAPYQIALYRDGYFVCGGSIISADWVLTAAHCVDDGGDYGIRAGSRYIRRGGQIRYARYVVINNGFNPNTLNHDIAMIRVGRPFNWNRNVRPARIAKPKWKLPRKYLVSGWGTQKENSNKPSYGLRGVTVKKVYRNSCRADYKKKADITKMMICASSPGKDACQGDSGGPLALKGVQYGITSFGIGCARSAYPGVYTNLRREYSWIRNVVRRFGGKMPRMMK